MLFRSAREEDSSLSEDSYYHALALKKLGKGSEATALLNQLVSTADLDGEEPISNGMRSFLAGLGEEGQDHFQQARSEFEKALSLDPSLWRAKRQLERLKEN